MSDKKHVNIGTTGHVDHGKTTLTAALSYVTGLAKDVLDQIKNESVQGILVSDILDILKASGFRSFFTIDNAPEEKARGITINATTIEYETKHRHYSHTDCPGHADFIKNMIVGAQNLDGAILVIDATQGIQAQTTEHLKLLSRLGIKKIVIALNKCDIASEEFIELCAEMAKDLAKSEGYEEVPIVCVSAIGALNNDKKWLLSIVELLKTIEDTILTPDRDYDSPFELSVEGVHSIKGRGTVVTGRVDKGTLNLGETVEVVTLSGKILKCAITDIEAFKKKLLKAQAGDNVGILLPGIGRDDVERGDLVAKNGSFQFANEFIANIFMLSKEEGGRATPVRLGYKPQMYYRTMDITVEFCEIEPAIIPSDQVEKTSASKVDSINPGDNVLVRFQTLAGHKYPLKEGGQFTLREGGKTIGAGKIFKTFLVSTVAKEVAAPVASDKKRK